MVAFIFIKGVSLYQFLRNYLSRTPSLRVSRKIPQQHLAQSTGGKEDLPQVLRYTIQQLINKYEEKVIELQEKTRTQEEKLRALKQRCENTQEDSDRLEKELEAQREADWQIGRTIKKQSREIAGLRELRRINKKLRKTQSTNETRRVKIHEEQCREHSLKGLAKTHMDELRKLQNLQATQYGLIQRLDIITEINRKNRNHKKKQYRW